MRKQDEANLKLVTNILDKFGWLGEDMVGARGNSALFLVIQHSDQKTQEKYLPIMREAVKKGNADPGSLALLEDRVALAQGKKQIYGSQLTMDPETGKYVLSPIEDEINVNKRRAEVGLQPIEEYVKYWGIEYKPGVNQLPDSFLRKNAAWICIVSIIFLWILVSFLFGRVLKVNILFSELFWFSVLVQCMALYAWYNERSMRDAAHIFKSISFEIVGFIVLMGPIFLLDLILSKLFKRKHLLIQLISVAAGFSMFMLWTGRLSRRLFYPNEHIQFFFNIIPLLITLGIFLIIWATLYWLKKRVKNRALHT